jgi:hypothetical protein
MEEGKEQTMNDDCRVRRKKYRNFMTRMKRRNIYYKLSVAIRNFLTMGLPLVRNAF